MTRIRTSKSKPKVLLGILFTSEAKIEPKMKRWMGAVSIVIVSLYQSER